MIYILFYASCYYFYFFLLKCHTLFFYKTTTRVFRTFVCASPAANEISAGQKKTQSRRDVPLINNDEKYRLFPPWLNTKVDQTKTKAAFILPRKEQEEKKLFVLLIKKCVFLF